MEQVLKITSTPIEYKYDVQPSRLEYKQDFISSADVSQRNAALSMRSSNISVRLDTLDMRRSMGFQSFTDIGASYRERASENVQSYMEEQARFGKAMSQSHKGVTIGEVVKQKVLEQPQQYMVFLPETGPRISWEPNQLNTKYHEGALNYDWNIARNVMEYIPGKFQMNIVRYPKVTIEYVGEPNYIPKSANPNYQESTF